MPKRTRPALSRDTIVDTAIGLLDASGLAGLSMRKVADAMGTGAMSLYNHVKDKDDLLGGALESLLRDVPQPTVGDDWREPIRHVVGWLRTTLQAHPWACELWPTTFPGPNRKQLMETVLRVLREGGFDRVMAHHGFHALDLFVVGHVHQEAAFTISGNDPEQTMRDFLASTPRETYPHMIEHVELHAERGLDEDDFAFLLELLLDGLAQHR